MYDYISGTLVEKEITYAVIDCGGVGYLAHIPVSTYRVLPGVGTTLKLYVHFGVKEDDLRFFGFFTRGERALFKKLLNVNKIGPKIAVSVLSTFDVDTFVQAVLSHNDKLISTVPGLGKKTAQKLIIELQESLSSLSIDKTELPTGGMYIDAEKALAKLNYSNVEIRWAFQQIDSQEIKTSQALVKKAMQLIFSKR